jgi:hypothetical protein
MIGRTGHPTHRLSVQPRRRRSGTARSMRVAAWARPVVAGSAPLGSAGRTDISTILDPCRCGNVERGTAPPSGNCGGFDFFSISA